MYMSKMAVVIGNWHAYSYSIYRGTGGSFYVTFGVVLKILMIHTLPFSFHAFIRNPSKKILIFSEFVKIHKTKIRILES